MESRLAVVVFSLIAVGVISTRAMVAVLGIITLANAPESIPIPIPTWAVVVAAIFTGIVTIHDFVWSYYVINECRKAS